MGLVLGPQFLNVIPWSGKIGSYAYMLVCVLFGGLFLGKKIKPMLKQILTKVGDSFCVNMGAEFFLFWYCTAGRRCTDENFVSKCIYRNCPADAIWIFAVDMAMLQRLERHLTIHWDVKMALYLGQTFATVGLLVGLFVGIACINYATRHGGTRLVEKSGISSGRVPHRNRSSR